MPEHITSGLYPLRSLVRELMVKRTHVYPRFVCFGDGVILLTYPFSM